MILATGISLWYSQLQENPIDFFNMQNAQDPSDIGSSQENAIDQLNIENSHDYSNWKILSTPRKSYEFS